MDEMQEAIIKHLQVLEDNMIALTAKLDRFMREKEEDIEKNPLKNLSERAKYIRQLDGMKKVITEKCSCGEHVGIRFIDENGTVVEDSMCPADWWVYKSRLAYLDGELDTFLDTTPIETYLNYGKKDK